MYDMRQWTYLTGADLNKGFYAARRIDHLYKNVNPCIECRYVRMYIYTILRVV